MTLDPADIRAIAEQIADVLAERGLLAPAAPRTRALSAAQVADMLGRSLDWVYEHQADLGAFRYGTGPKARLGFDLTAIEAWKTANAVGAAPNPTPPAAAMRRRRSPTTPGLIPYDPI